MIIACLSLSYSQVETHYLNNGEATKLINKPIRSKGVVKVMPSFDLAQLEKEDAERDSTGGLFRFGKPFDVSYTLTDGQWEEVDGGRMWSMTFKSGGALSLNFLFNDFHLSEGAELYVVNKDESVLFGPVTKESTTENGVFLTDILKGDQASVYLFEPTDQEGTSSLTIKRVVHGYRNFESTRESDRTSVYTPDVACQPYYEMESNAVAMILHGSGICIGTGFLIMSADYSFKPYLLTSSMIVDSNDNGIITSGELYDAENGMFKFRYKKATCEGSSLVTSYTYNQANLRASWSGTRFALFELKSNLKANLTLTWLGWDYLVASNADPACIHHPCNDVMKISFTNGPFYYNSGYYWYAWFTNGTVYSYSIGAPLLNGAKRVFGHVSNLFYPLGGYDEPNSAYIGQFARSWEGGGTNTTRLKNWLDPNNTTIQCYMNSHHSVGNLNIIGDSIISFSESNVYYVSNLPSDMTVTWSINDSYYQGELEQDEPLTNQCTIYGDTYHELYNATLTASVYKNGALVQRATKVVSTPEVFYGTYYNGQTTKQINLPNPLYVLPGTDACISSQNLVGASVYYDGNATPYTWSFNSSSGILHVGMPTSSGDVIAVHVTTALGNNFVLYILKTSVVYSMSIGTDLRTITISLVENDRGSIQPMDNGSKHTSWKLEVYNSTNGNKVFSQEVDGESFVIDTTGWDPGIYIVKAYIGDEVLSEKIVVK